MTCLFRYLTDLTGDVIVVVALLLTLGGLGWWEIVRDDSQQRAGMVIDGGRE